MQQFLEHQKEEEGPKEKKESGKCVEEKVPDANPNTGESYSGMKNGGQKRKASWPKKLDDVDWDRFETGGDGEWLIKKWKKRRPTKRLEVGWYDVTPSPVTVKNKPYTPTEEHKKNTILVWAAADIIERYWQMVFAPFPNVKNVKLKFKSNWRPAGSKTSMHNFAAAMDYEVQYVVDGKTETVPQIYQWAVTLYLSGAKRIPKGGSGMYLNQNIPGVPTYTVEPSEHSAGSKYIGATGLSFEEQGVVVKDPGGWNSPGGSAGGPHWDFRGHAGSPKEHETYWIFINTHAKGPTDDISSYEGRWKKVKDKLQLKGGSHRAVAMDFLKKYNPEVHSFINDYWKNHKQPPQFPGWPYTLIPANEKIPNWNQILGREDWTEEDDEPLVADAGTN